MYDDTIRKLLSRKFNFDCLNVAGLLTRVRLPTFPPCRTRYGLGSGLEEVTGIPRSTGGQSLQLREQFRIYTGFPFNPALPRNGRNRNSVAKLNNFKLFREKIINTTFEGC